MPTRQTMLLGGLLMVAVGPALHAQTTINGSALSVRMEASVWTKQCQIEAIAGAFVPVGPT